MKDHASTSNSQIGQLLKIHYETFLLEGSYYALFYCLLFNLFDLIELIRIDNKGLSSTLFFLPLL